MGDREKHEDLINALTTRPPSRDSSAHLIPEREGCPHSQLLLWCYGSLGIAAHNMLWAAMGGPSRVHGVMAREATPDCSPLEFSLRALPRAREVGSASIAKYFLFCPQVKFNNINLPPD